MKKIGFINKIVLASLLLVIFSGFAFVQKSEAAYLNITGFETGDSSELYSTNGTYSIQSLTKRTGNYALRINPSGTNGGVTIRGLATNGNGAFLGRTAATYYTFYFYMGSLPGSNLLISAWRDSGSNNIASLYVNSSGVLTGFGASGFSANIATLNAGTWYRIEAKIVSNGLSEAKVDGGTPQTWTSYNYTQDQLVLGDPINSYTANWYYDDVAISDSAYPGAGQVNILKPKGAGFAQLWGTGTGTAYNQVNEVPPNGDTTYIRDANTAGNVSTFTVDSSSTAGVSNGIGTVKTLTICKTEAGSSPGTIVRLRTNSPGITNSDTTSSDPGIGAYASLAKLNDTNPNNGSGWTTATLDAIEIGVLNGSTSSTERCTGLYAMVWSTPPAAPTVTTSAASSLTTNSAILNSTVNPNGASTSISYLWGTTPGVACNLQPNTLAGPTGLTGTSNLSGATTQATLPSLSANQTYYFCVMATNANGTRYDTAVLPFTTSATPGAYTYMDAGSALGSGATDCQDDSNGTPCAPTTVNVSAPAYNQTSISWSGTQTGGAVPSITNGYDLLRCTNGSCSPSATLTSTALTSYTDNTVSQTTTYGYAVKAKNAAGAGTASATSYVTTPSSCVNTTVYADNDGDHNGASSTIQFKGSAAGTGYNTGSTASVTINNPAAGVDSGVVLIASITFGGSSIVLTPPAGWNLINRVDNNSPTVSSTAVYYKVAVGGEPASYTWSASPNVTAFAGNIVAYDNVNSSSPVDTSQVTVIGNNNSLQTAFQTSSGITTSYPYELIVVVAGAYRSSGLASWTPPAGMTERADTNNTGGRMVSISDVMQNSAGPTGVKSATLSSSGYGGVIIFGLRSNYATTTLCVANNTPTGPWSMNANDCNDNNINLYQNLNAYVDGDKDGVVGNSATPVCSGGALPAGFNSSPGTDCNDSDATKWQNLSGYQDSDGDGYTTSTTPSNVCSGASLPSGYRATSSGLDCYDGNATANPGYSGSYQTTNRGDGSFDYNCSNSMTSYLGTSANGQFSGYVCAAIVQTSQCVGYDCGPPPNYVGCCGSAFCSSAGNTSCSSTTATTVSCGQTAINGNASCALSGDMCMGSGVVCLSPQGPLGCY